MVISEYCSDSRSSTSAATFTRARKRDRWRDEAFTVRTIKRMRWNKLLFIQSLVEKKQTYCNIQVCPYQWFHNAKVKTHFPKDVTRNSVTCDYSGTFQQCFDLYFSVLDVKSLPKGTFFDVNVQLLL